MDPDVPACRRPIHPQGKTHRKTFEETGSRIDEVHLDGAATFGAQALQEGEGQLYASGTPAHYYDAKRRVVASGARLLENALEALNELCDGSRRDGEVTDSRPIQTGNRGAYVERRQIVGEALPPYQDDLLASRIDQFRRCHDALDPCPSTELMYVDLQILGTVLTGDESGHHPGIDGDGIVHHHGDPGGCQGTLGEALQYLHMGMAAADQKNLALHDLRFPGARVAQSERRADETSEVLY